MNDDEEVLAQWGPSHKRFCIVVKRMTFDDLLIAGAREARLAGGKNLALENPRPSRGDGGRFAEGVGGVTFLKMPSTKGAAERL